MAAKLLMASLLALATAQTTTLTLPFIGFDSQTLSASVVTVKAGVTTFQLACGGATACGLFPQQTYVVGPSTYSMDDSDPDSDFTMTQDCVLASTSAVCKESAGGSEANFPGSSTITYNSTDITAFPLTVTAGVAKLNAQATATSNGTSGIASASTGSGASKTTAKATRSTGASKTGSATGSAPAMNTTNAAAANSVVLGGGLVGAAAGLLGGLLL